MGTETRTTVADIARFVVAESGLSAVIKYTGGDRGWVGDVPNFQYDCTALAALKWRPKMTSDQAVQLAAREIWADYR